MTWHQMHVIAEPSAYSRHTSLRPTCTCGWIGTTHSGPSVRHHIRHEYTAHLEGNDGWDTWDESPDADEESG